MPLTNRLPCYSDLEQLRQHQATQEAESQNLTSQSQAMLNLNLKLQSTVLKSQVKAIDLELRELEARQAAEHLAIVQVSAIGPSSAAATHMLTEFAQPYLPPAFFESDSDAVDALLFFERVGEKVALLVRYIEQKHTVGEALDGTVPDDLIGICEVSRFCPASSALHTTTLSSHPLSIGPEQTRPLCGTQQTLLRTLATLSPGDLPQDGKRLPRSRLDGEANRRIRRGFEEGRVARDQLRQRSGRVSLRPPVPPRCAPQTDSPADRIIAQTEHLAETVLRDLDPMLDLFERESACVGSLDLDLDTIAVAAGFAKQTVAAISREPGTSCGIALYSASADNEREQMSQSSWAAVISTMPSSSPCRTLSITPATPKSSSSTPFVSMCISTSAS
jgi:dynactin 1